MGNYYNFQEFGNLVKYNKEVMICFVHIAKKQMMHGDYFYKEYSLGASEKEYLFNMISFLSSNFTFDDHYSLNIYVDFLGFLLK